MARPTVWQRAFREGGNFPEANLHLYDVAVLNPGETVGRIRFDFQGVHSPNFGVPGEGYSFLYGVGIIVQPITVPVGSVPRPLTDPQADWMWWETCHWRTEFAFENNIPNVQSVDSFPDDPGERDVRAQRGPMTETSNVWVVAEASGDGGAQTFTFFSVGISILNILPLP